MVKITLDACGERLMKETDIVKQILIGIGREFPMIRAWRQNTGATVNPNGQFVKFGIPGQADISGIMQDGRRLEIEVKRPGGKISDDQFSFKKMIQSHEGLYFLVYSWEETRDALSKHIILW